MTSTLAPDAVNLKVADVLRLPVERVTDDTALQDLALDSFALVELVVELQEEFSVQFVQEDLPGIHTVGDIVRLVHERRKVAR